jgi:hypothetical protein
VGAENPKQKFDLAQECLQTVDGRFLASAIERGLVPVGRDCYLSWLNFNRRSSSSAIHGFWPRVRAIMSALPPAGKVSIKLKGLSLQFIFKSLLFIIISY